MRDTLYTRMLVRAAEAEGGMASLASLLHAPENTLERWMSGRAQMPVRAFLKVLDRLAMNEENGTAPTAPLANGEPLTFAMGELLARCSRCDGTEFAPAQPGAPLKLTSLLECRACGEQVVHGDLIAQLAQDALQQSHAMTVARTRRQAALRSTSRKKSDVQR